MNATAVRRKERPAAGRAGTYRSVDERREGGRALREAVSRASHSGWKVREKARDPVALLQSSNAGRIPQLVPIRFGRMAQSPFAFYRGAAALMASDLATTPVSGIRVQACGDAHLMNFGAFATPERNVIFDINDLDETLPAPWEWDVKRLAASVAIAAQHLAFAESDVARIAVDLVREYRERMTDYASMRVLDVWYDRIDLAKYSERVEDPEIAAQMQRRIKDRMEEARRKSVPDHLYPKLVRLEGSELRIRDEPPLIFHPDPKEFPGTVTGYRDGIAAYRDTLPEHVRTAFDRFRFVDLALKVVGVGSVGTHCAVALFMAGDDDPLFLQIKEARASVLEPYAGKSLHPNHGQRVVAGQRLMQSASDIFLGWVRGQDGRDYYLRQLRDMKMSAIIEGWSVGLLRAYARMCAQALARAHARSGDPARIAGYAGASRTLDDAIGEFAIDYADQNRADYRTFVRAIREGRIEAIMEP